MTEQVVPMFSPDRASPPLPASTKLVVPSEYKIHAELRRAQIELMYAIIRHRRAWAALKEYRDARDEQAVQRGLPAAYLDSDPRYQLKVGDVEWWRGEMNAQANTVQALTTMQNLARGGGL